MGGANPKISPNKTMISVYMDSGTYDLPRLGIYDAKTRILTPLKNGPFNVVGINPIWHPSSQRLYYVERTSSGSSSAYYNFFENRSIYYAPSQDVEIIGFINDSTALAKYNIQLVWMNSEGKIKEIIDNPYQYPNTAPKPYEKTNIFTRSPVWLRFYPHSKKLLGYVLWGEDNINIYSSIVITDINGTYFKYITKDKTYDIDPCWGPEGRIIIFRRWPKINSVGGSWVYKLDIFTNGIKPLIQKEKIPDYDSIGIFDYYKSE
jgi:Tol biopolymer transport system component